MPMPPRIISLAICISLVLGASACSSEDNDLAPALKDACAQALPTIESVRDPFRSGLPVGYGDAQNFLGDPSIYQTGWSLRLADELNIAPAQVNRERLREWASKQLAGSLDETSVEGLSAVDRIGLLRSMASDSLTPEQQLLQLDFLRTPDGYANEFGGPSSPVATYLALSTVKDVSQVAPAGVVEKLKHEARNISGDESFEVIIESALPRLSALGLALETHDFAEQFPRAREITKKWFDTIDGLGGGPAQLSALGMLRSLHDRHDTYWSALPSDYAENMRSDLTGYFSLDGKSQGDPQITYLAARIGLVIDVKQVAMTLNRGSTPRGWLLNVTGPTVTSMYKSASVLLACKKDLPDIGDFLAASLEQELSQGADAATLYQLTELLTWYKIEISQGDKSRMVDLATSVNERAVSAGDIRSQAFARGTIDALGLPSATIPAPTTNKFKPVDSQTAFAGFILGQVSDDEVLKSRAAKYLRELGDGTTWAWTPERQAQPDLFSTGFGIASSKGSMEARAQSLSFFEADGLWAMTPPGQDQDNVVTLSSLATAVTLLSQDTSDLQLLALV